MARTGLGSRWAMAAIGLSVALLAAPAPASAQPDVAARVRAHVDARMPRLHPAKRARVARAILGEARQAGVDPLLVLALIHVESSFDPDAVSSAGAVGLMQLRETTLRGEAERWGVTWSDPRDPVTSIQAGVRYLRYLIDRFGELDAALMAYNAGPARILGHLARGEVPERYQVYPAKVRSELERLRRALVG